MHIHEPGCRLVGAGPGLTPALFASGAVGGVAFSCVLPPEPVPPELLPPEPVPPELLPPGAVGSLPGVFVGDV